MIVTTLSETSEFVALKDEQEVAICFCNTTDSHSTISLSYVSNNRATQLFSNFTLLARDFYAFPHKLSISKGDKLLFSGVGCVMSAVK